MDAPLRAETMSSHRERRRDVPFEKTAAGAYLFMLQQAAQKMHVERRAQRIQRVRRLGPVSRTVLDGGCVLLQPCTGYFATPTRAR